MEKYSETAYRKLLDSYMAAMDWLKEEEVDATLRIHAKKRGGCISCQYSIFKDDKIGCFRNKNIWTVRKCQLGFSQDDCEMHKDFPEQE